MIWFVVALILGVVGAALIAFAGRAGSQDAPIVRGVGIALFAVTLIVLGFDSTTSIQARTVGVETSYGKPVGALSSGLHVVRPWSKIDDSWDGTIQTDVFEVPNVRLANGTTATADVSVQYQIDTGSQFLTLWRQYKSFDTIKTNVIERQTRSALNQVFEQFNPLTSIDQSGTQTVAVSSFGPQVERIVAAAMPTGLAIKNLTLPQIIYSDQVQGQINSIIAATAASRVAVQNEQTALANEAANNDLAEGNTSPGVLYQQCLTMTQAALKAGEALPPGWSCSAAGASVVIPAGK